MCITKPISLFLIIVINSRFTPVLLYTSSFFLVAVYGNLNTLLTSHISTASSLFLIFLLIVLLLHPNNIPDLVHVLHNRIFVCMFIPRFLNIVLICQNAAFPIKILDLISLSNFPSSLTRLPQYLNSITLSILLPS